MIALHMDYGREAHAQAHRHLLQGPRRKDKRPRLVRVEGRWWALLPVGCAEDSPRARYAGAWCAARAMAGTP